MLIEGLLTNQPSTLDHEPSLCLPSSLRKEHYPMRRSDILIPAALGLLCTGLFIYGILSTDPDPREAYGGIIRELSGSFLSEERMAAAGL